jgi:hypothetical protein
MRQTALHHQPHETCSGSSSLQQLAAVAAAASSSSSFQQVEQLHSPLYILVV